MQPFLITGLPRSRTAWWAVVASTPYSICLHEPAKDCQTFKELKDLWLSMPTYAGFSDSGLALQLGRILKEIKPRTLIVDRDPQDVLASFKKYWGKKFDEDAAQRLLAGAMAELQKHAKNPLVRTVKFEALNDYDTAAECYRWLMPGNPVPLREDLFHMRVNVGRDYVSRVIERPHSGWHLQ